MNFAGVIEDNSALFAKSPAVINGSNGEMLTYRELWEQIDRVAAGLVACGVRPDDRVGLYLPNGVEFIISYFAIMKIGAVVVPFNILFRGPEIQYILENSRAKVLIGASRELMDNLSPVRQALPDLQTVIGVGEHTGVSVDGWLDEWLAGDGHVETVPREDNQLAAILYTSGTTGRPKGAMLSHRNLTQNAKLNGHYLMGLNDQDRALGLSPYNHVFFVQIVLGPLAVGASIVTLPRSSPELALEAIGKYQVTHFSGVPTIFRYMLQRYKEKKFNVTSWRVAGSAAASIDAELVKQIETTFGVDFFEAYGSTEISSTVTYTRLRHPKPGSIGLPLHGYEVKLIDDAGRDVATGEVGELVVKGPGVFLGYWGMPEATSEVLSSDGWYKTGDLARRDEDEYLYIVDRKKEMIVSGGYNVYPREIEDVLLSHPKIAEAAIIGRQDQNLGEVPVAFIILKQGMTLEQDEVIAFCNDKLAKYKIPRLVQFVEDFPRTGSGKILKRMLA